MTLKIDGKFEEKLICCFKNDNNFDPGILKSQNLLFNWFLLCKVFNVWPKKVWRSYLSWHWRVIPNLERDQLVISKLTWGIWQILTWALESLKNVHFNGLFLTKVYIVWDKKVQRSYLHNTNEWCKIWRKTDLWFAKWHEEFGKFSPEHLKVLKIGTLMGSFCPK